MEPIANYKTVSNKNCPFCFIESDRQIIAESTNSIAFYDKFPVNKGHALIVPKRHVGDYFELTLEEQYECIKLLNRVKEIIKEAHNPDGFNMGINIGKYAGQTIDHVHIHLIPRYKGDVSEPRGGVRGVIPHKRLY